MFCSDDDNGDSDEGISSEDVLRSLMVPPLLNSEVSFSALRFRTIC